MKIIVAEDNEVSAMLLDKILTKEGYRVIIAKNGMEAWEQVHSSGADTFDRLDDAGNYRNRAL